MPSRAPASPKDIPTTTTVADALKRSARLLMLLSILIGTLVFAGLSVWARGSVADLAERAQLSVLAAVAGLMIGAATIAAGTLIRHRAAGKHFKRPATGKKREDAPRAKSELLLAEMSDLGAGVSARAAAAFATPHGLGALDEPLTEVVAPPREIVRPLPAFVEMEALASRLKARRPSAGGHRALITGSSEAIIPFEEACELAKSLAESGAQTILIDWSPSGEGFARARGLDTRSGWNALMNGEARFDDIIQRLPGTRAHAIASGSALRDGSARLDADLLNVALDALDEVYDHIIVTARHDEARALFECIEGRFDAGIAVAAHGDTEAVRNDGCTFLGFEVADIDILRYQQPERAAAVPPVVERIARATRARESLARTA
ncbi:MAG: hypothetical protein JSR99_10840 [Proteobacteria bacterium]|nr:hypothetical protein [Pseudomonadota bacterium]